MFTYLCYPGPHGGLRPAVPRESEWFTYIYIQGGLGGSVKDMDNHCARCSLLGVRLFRADRGSANVLRARQSGAKRGIGILDTKTLLEALP